LAELCDETNINDPWKAAGLEFNKYQYIVMKNLKEKIIPFFAQESITV
jgi:hypothetical protein